VKLHPRAPAAPFGCMSFLPVNVTDLPQCADWSSMGSGIRDIMIGFGLVVFASAGICGALNLQKLVHVRNADPVTGEPHVHFARLPLWWAGILLNTVSELVNLAALGFAPATLVTPLGCITVAFNSVTSVVWLGEPFLKRDMLGILVLVLGVACVVMSQVGAPVQPITPDYLINNVLVSPVFWAYIGFVVVALFVLRVFVEKKYATRFSWVYLTESALVGSISTVAARAFSSMTMPGVAAASGTPSGCPGQSRLVCNLAGPYCWTTWSSLVLLVLGASSSLVLQNKAMMHFGNSEVVPIYFCLFTVGGVLGAAMAYDELCWPWVLLFVPGLGLCMVGVFAITYRRQNRLAAHQLSNAALQNGDGGPDGEVDDVRASNMSHASAFDEAESLLTLGGASMSSTANIMALHKPPSTPTAESLLPGGGGNSPRR